jgi:hypothetical protein
MKILAAESRRRRDSAVKRSFLHPYNAGYFMKFFLPLSHNKYERQKVTLSRRYGFIKIFVEKIS